MNFANDKHRYHSEPAHFRPARIMQPVSKKHLAQYQNIDTFIQHLQSQINFIKTTGRIYHQLIHIIEIDSHPPLQNSQEIKATTEEFRDDIAAHFQHLTAYAQLLGSSPTVYNSVEVNNQVATALYNLMIKPSTSVTEGLEIVSLVAVKASTNWDLLICLANDAGLYDIGQHLQNLFEEAMSQLSKIKQWHEDAVRSQNLA